jgi:hypothetical protein
MLRVDNAGNVSKRFSSGTFPFSKFGGTCPLWNVHSTFDTPDRLLKQVIELPDGTRYFSIAQAVRRPVALHPYPQPRFAIALGCEIRHAGRLAYAAGMNLETTEGTPIGVNCRLCERENCAQRAEPPITRSGHPLSTRNGRMRASRSSLLLDFDGISSDDLDRLLPLRSKVRPDLRFVECHRSIQAVPFGERCTAWRCAALYRNDPPSCRTQRATMGLFDQLARRRQISSLSGSIEDFIFANDVRFQPGSLSVDSLNRESAKRGADQHHYCVSRFGFHGKVPPSGRRQQSPGQGNGAPA